MPQLINGTYSAAHTWVQRRDPLTLDLDGDGLETVGIDTANPILFDHDGDGVKNATGWVKPDDGFLVLDRNGDGLINNGTELFGDSTPVLDAQGNFVRKAVDGFDALAQQDSNGDGLVNHQDANWASLRVWQDANGDGISQSSELKTLEQLGIAALRVAKTENNSAIGNGNVLADLGGYIRQDGSEGTLGEVSGTMADIDLADNPFYREFTDSVDTSAVAHLPDMQGSGAVRDLREAAALSPGLASVLQSYASATTKAEQTALLGELLNQWGATGNFNTSVERAQEQGFALRYFNSQGQDVTAWVELLETFNGATFVQVGVGGVRTGAGGWMTPSSVATGVGGETWQVLNFTLSADQVSLLGQSYDALKQSVYDGLLLQTRFKSYIDQIGISLAGDGVTMDFSALETTFQTLFEQSPKDAVRDLLELQRAAGTELEKLGWQGYGYMEDWLSRAASDAQLKALVSQGIAEAGYSLGASDRVDMLIGAAGGDDLSGASGDDLLFGLGGDDVLDGGVGSDRLFGGAGNDQLYGSNGDDVLDGGAGNDTLQGGDGSDTYIFRRGEGSDLLQNYDASAGRVDKLKMEGINAEDVRVEKRGEYDIALVLKDTGESVQLYYHFYSGYYQIDTVEFADGTKWGRADLAANIGVPGTQGNDTLNGSTGADRLYGLAGNDTLAGNAGADVLEGGTGADTLNGGTGNDTYVFRRGDGVDTVLDDDATAGNQDVLKFSTDVASDQLWFQRNGADLQISIIGTDDQVTVSNWYSGSQYHIEQIKTRDGKTLLDSQVDQLVQAMAGFAPPSAGETTLPQSYQATLVPVLAANWS